MKKSIALFSVALITIGLAGCGNSNDDSQNTDNVKTTQTGHRHHRAANSSSAANQGSEAADSSSASTESEQHVINSADDAARLVAHAMAAEDSLYHATPVAGGFEVVRPDMNQKAFVHYDGSVTWDDGTTQPYAEVSAPEDNGRVNSTFAPSN